MVEINLSEYLKNKQKKSDTVIIFSKKEPIINNFGLKIIGDNSFAFVRDDYNVLKLFIEQNDLKNYEIFRLSVNQKADLLKYENDYRIEPGAIIREKVKIGKNAVILMNATINIGAEIGENSMIDMGTIIGSKAKIGASCHIGANSVIAGVLEPESSKEVIIEDNVFIGANSVVLEGIKIGHNSIIGAMTLVNKDIPPNSLVVGVPCKIIGLVNEKVNLKCQNNLNLR